MSSPPKKKSSIDDAIAHNEILEADLQEAQHRYVGAATALQDIKQDLDAIAGGLQASWIGESYQTYLDRQGKLTTAVQNGSDTLQKGSVEIGKMRDAYIEADDQMREAQDSDDEVELIMGVFAVITTLAGAIGVMLLAADMEFASGMESITGENDANILVPDEEEINVDNINRDNVDEPVGFTGVGNVEPNPGQFPYGDTPVENPEENPTEIPPLGGRPDSGVDFGEDSSKDLPEAQPTSETSPEVPTGNQTLPPPSEQSEPLPTSETPSEVPTGNQTPPPPSEQLGGTTIPDGDTPVENPRDILENSPIAARTYPTSESRTIGEGGAEVWSPDDNTTRYQFPNGTNLRIIRSPDVNTENILFPNRVGARIDSNNDVQIAVPSSDGNPTIFEVGENGTATSNGFNFTIPPTVIHNTIADTYISITTIRPGLVVERTVTADGTPVTTIVSVHDYQTGTTTVLTRYGDGQVHVDTLGGQQEAYLPTYDGSRLPPYEDPPPYQEHQADPANSSVSNNGGS